MKGRCLYIAALLMVISLAAPAVLPLQFGMGRAAAADPGLMKWQAVQTPGSFPGKNDNLTFKIGRGDILNPQFPVGSDIAKGSDILDMAVLGGTLKATIRTWWIDGKYRIIKLSSTDNGISAMNMVSSSTSICADSSFLPPWRAISTEKVRPRRFSMLSSTARATSSW